jgi:YHS domain-containing protein
MNGSVRALPFFFGPRFAPVRAWMKGLLAAAAILLLSSCEAAPVSQADATPPDAVSIDSTPMRPAILEPPPMLQDEAPPPKPKTMPWETPKPIVFTPEDEKVRASLPFSPAIAMDPVDGSKISIRATTPTAEYKGKIYYFSSETNKQMFMGNPEAALKGGFMKL